MILAVINNRGGTGKAQSAVNQAGPLAGPRNPYPGRLGVIEEGTYADILLVNKNPREKISILGGPNSAGLALIMKDGKIYKNTIK